MGILLSLLVAVMLTVALYMLAKNARSLRKGDLREMLRNEEERLTASVGGVDMATDPFDRMEEETLPELQHITDESLQQFLDAETSGALASGDIDLKVSQDHERFKKSYDAAFRDAYRKTVELNICSVSVLVDHAGGRPVAKHKPAYIRALNSTTHARKNLARLDYNMSNTTDYLEPLREETVESLTEYYYSLLYSHRMRLVEAAKHSVQRNRRQAVKSIYRANNINRELLTLSAMLSTNKVEVADPFSNADVNEIVGY